MEKCQEQTYESETDSGGCTKAKKRKNKDIENRELGGSATDMPVYPKRMSKGEGVASQEAGTADVSKKDVEEYLPCDITDGEEEEGEGIENIKLGRGAVKLSRPEGHQRTQLQSAGDADLTQTSPSTSYAEPNQLRRIPRAHSPTSPFSTRIQESFGEPEVPLTDESDTESGGCTKAKRRRKNKEIENKECADGATDLTPENPKGKSREQRVASQEPDTAGVEECLLGDYTDGEEEEREEKEGEEEEEEEGDGDGIKNMSQLGAGTAKVKFQTVKQHSYKLVDRGMLAERIKDKLMMIRFINESCHKPLTLNIIDNK